MSTSQIVQSTKSFLRHERQHTNDVMKKRRKTPYRERSIDDGSRYDPRIDRVTSHHSHSRTRSSTTKHEKKSGGLQRVKEFIDATKKMLVGEKKEHKRGSASDDEVRKRYREYGGDSRFGRVSK